MKPSYFMKAIQACTTDRGYAIIKAIKVNKEFTYNLLAEFLGIEQRKNFTYNLRQLKKYKVIAKNNIIKTYFLTTTGINMLNIIEKYFEERTLNEEPTLICVNSKDGEHKFIEICKKCSFIKKDKGDSKNA